MNSLKRLKKKKPKDWRLYDLTKKKKSLYLVQDRLFDRFVFSSILI